MSRICLSRGRSPLLYLPKTPFSCLRINLTSAQQICGRIWAGGRQTTLMEMRMWYGASSERRVRAVQKSTRLGWRRRSRPRRRDACSLVSTPCHHVCDARTQRQGLPCGWAAHERVQYLWNDKRVTEAVEMVAYPGKACRRRYVGRQQNEDAEYTIADAVIAMPTLNAPVLSA